MICFARETLMVVAPMPGNKGGKGVLLMLAVSGSHVSWGYKAWRQDGAAGCSRQRVKIKVLSLEKWPAGRARYRARCLCLVIVPSSGQRD